MRLFVPGEVSMVPRYSARIDEPDWAAALETEFDVATPVGLYDGSAFALSMPRPTMVRTQEWLDRTRHWLDEVESRAEWLPAAVARVTLGLVFIPAGWGKVQHLDKVTAMFEKLQIPFPAFNAALVGWSELVCGTLVLLGLMTRLATIPLMVIMVVAIATAKASHIRSLGDFIGMSEFLYILLLLYLLVLGAGSLSLDGLIRRRRMGGDYPFARTRGGWAFARSTT